MFADNSLNICMNSLTTLTKYPAETSSVLDKHLHFSGKLGELTTKNKRVEL